MKHRRECPDLREIRERVLEYVCANIIVTDEGCWEWQGHRNKLGYAQGCFGGRQWTITRLVQCATKGAFDPQLDMCHECDNPPCCNPDHVWPGTMPENIQDSVEKGRHFLASAIYCKRGHPLFGKNLYISPVSGKRPEKRSCLTCQRAMYRMRAGWPEDLAFNLPVQKTGFKPDGIGNAWEAARERRRGPKTHCKNGHPLSGENLYVVPSDGRRQCRACKYAVIKRLAAERSQAA